jgi:hypothetical protein
MLALRLVRLIEEHSEELAMGLTDKLRQSERTRDFRKVSSEGLCLAAAERRAAEGIGLDQFVWALVISRNHLWQFLQREAFADNVIQLSGKLELQQMLNQFYDRAMYYGVLGYTDAKDRKRDAQGTNAYMEGVTGVPIVIRTFGEKRRKY